jgi:hypothetical protein
VGERRPDDLVAQVQEPGRTGQWSHGRILMGAGDQAMPTGFRGAERRT